VTFQTYQDVQGAQAGTGLGYANQLHNSVQPLVDPGRTLGIVGLVLAFLMAPVGLVVSIIAYRKSKAAGFRAGLPLVGIIVAAIFLLIGIAVIGLGFHLFNTCASLGPGMHVVNGVTWTCG